MDQNMNSYTEFEMITQELSSRMDDYYGDGTFMGFKIRMESFLDNFKSEYFKNVVALSKENKTAYIAHLNNELERFRDVFNPGDKRCLDILTKFQIREENLFNHSQSNNELYQILTTELSTLKELYKNSSATTTTYDEIVDILRIFYKQYLYKFTETINDLVNGLAGNSA